MQRLEIGPGNSPLGDGWKVLDYVDGPNVDFVAMWGKERLPFEDNTWDYIYASHVLEHIPWHDAVDALKELHRVIRKGGQVEIHVPDFGKIVREWYLKGRKGAWGRFDDHMHWLNARIFGISLGEHNPAKHHLAVYDLGSLKRTLQMAGFTELKRSGPPRGREKHGTLDLGLIGRKP